MYFACAHDAAECELVTKAGASAEELDQFERRLGLRLPDEFKSLYGEFNGVGICSRDFQRVFWLFRALGEQEDFMAIQRSAFVATHPKYAPRFFPFVDWANGDSMGYLVDSVGALLSGLYCFDHEEYEYSGSQDIGEFLCFAFETIEDFLSLGENR